MRRHTRISMYVSKATNERLERCLRVTGASRTQSVEQALLHHLQAIEDLPTDAIVPARLVLDLASAERVRDLTERPSAPTEALSQLFDEDRG